MILVTAIPGRYHLHVRIQEVQGPAWAHGAPGRRPGSSPATCHCTELKEASRTVSPAPHQHHPQQMPRELLWEVTELVPTKWHFQILSDMHHCKVFLQLLPLAANPREGASGFQADSGARSRPQAGGGAGAAGKMCPAHALAVFISVGVCSREALAPPPPKICGPRLKEGQPRALRPPGQRALTGAWQRRASRGADAWGGAEGQRRRGAGGWKSAPVPLGDGDSPAQLGHRMDTG